MRSVTLLHIHTYSRMSNNYLLSVQTVCVLTISTQVDMTVLFVVAHIVSTLNACAITISLPKD